MILLRVAPDLVNYRPNMDIIKKRLQDYLEGRDISLDMSEFVPPFGGTMVAYGIKCLDFFLENENDLFAFCRETRMSYFLYEHEMLMNNRVCYLIENKHLNITDDEEKELITMAAENLKEAEIIKNNILISEMNIARRTTMDKIRDHIIALKEGQIKLYSKLIELL